MDYQLSKTPKQLSYRIVGYDFSIKRNILRLLVNHGCYLTIVR